MDGLKPPNSLCFDGNLSDNWKKWKQKYEIYSIASGSNKKDAEVQVAIFLHIIGEEAVEKYNTFDLTETEKKDVNKIIESFDNYCTPKSNESVDRHIFFTRTQQVGESFDEFLTALKKLSSACGFNDLKDSLIRDRIISGITDKNLKDRLLREGDLTLEKCVKICKSCELAEIQLKTLQEENKIEAINKVVTKPKHSNVSRTQSNVNKNYQNRYEIESRKSLDYKNKQVSFSKPCGKCGKFHNKFNCPAFNKVCLKCKKRNHFAKMCRSIRSVHESFHSNTSKLNYNDDSNECILGVVDNMFNNTKDWYEKLKINVSKYLFVKLDTGAQCNVLPWQKFKQLNVKNFVKSDTCLSNYNGSRITVLGKCTLLCETSKGKKAKVEFQIVESEANVCAVLGLPTLIELNLVQRVNSIEQNEKKYPEILENYKHLFDGLGDIDNYVYDIKLKPGAVGKVEPCRKVPIGLMEPLKIELDRMEKMNVIRKIDEPTEFVNSLVIVKKKDGSLRLCLDPQYLNSNILREHYPLPTFEETIAKMSGAKIFSILDANTAFWQIKLSEKSSKLTTFNTPFGRYCFLRMPYGICSAPEVFHKCFSELFENIPGTQIYIDDILVWGKNKTEHDLRLKQVLEKAHKKNIKFNLDKCKIGLSEVKYLGHKISKNGLEPDEEKVRAILKMEQPKNKKELERFLGMITYISRFIPNVSQKTTRLRNLLKKNNIWSWDKVHEECFNDLKHTLASKPVLQYFDINKPFVLSVDSSQDGLGAVLIQNNLPVAYASKALTETQKNYAQIEKETLAIVFACEKFHQYIFGQTFTIETDHKPLETIFKKPLNTCPARLQRMLIRLQPYTFTLVYKPGKELFLADALSRSFLKESKDFFEGEIETHVGMIVNSLPMSKEKLKMFQDAVNNDPEMQALKDCIINGWPNQKELVPDIVKPYFHFKEELSFANGLILKNSRVVVPKQLRKDMLNRIHYNHLGVEKCKNKAREILYWPGMSKEIENLILNCTTCLSFRKSQTNEPLIPKEIPHGPWEVLGTDLFYFQGSDYLIVIDYFSKYIEITKMPEISSVATIKILKMMFARYGIPKIVYSDNGPQYNSYRFKHFAKTWGFEHRTSSPRYPQSNGMPERHIQTLKSMLQKAEFDGKDPYLVLLEYRNTPISNEIPSPSELLFGRKVRGIMPIKEDFFSTDKYLEDRRKLLERQEIQRRYYDRNAKSLKPLNEKDNVFIDEEKKGPKTPAIVLSKATRPRSYIVMKEDGTIVERNRKHLIKVPRKFPFKVKKRLEFTEPEEVSTPYHTAPGRCHQTPSTDTRETPPNDQGENLRYSRTGRLIKKPMYLKDYV